jgi:predicted regulator of Ras-like GTPase activity (Roadblock/LC7/MglB family)
MNPFDLRLDTAGQEKIRVILAALFEQCDSRAAILVSRSGQEISSHGDVGDLDRQSLASLAASSQAASLGMAQLIGENEFSRVYHKGTEHSILLIPVGELALLFLVLHNRRREMTVLKTLQHAALVLQDVLEEHCRLSDGLRTGSNKRR